MAQGTANLFTIMIEIIGVLTILLFFKFDWEKLIWSMGGKEKEKSSPGKWKHKKS